MGCAEIISFTDVRASKQWEVLRQQLHTRFDQWLDTLAEQLPEPPSTLSQVSDAVWGLRQSLTGGITETILTSVHEGERHRTQASCPQCARRLTAQGQVGRTVETMVGPVALERPYFYCRACCAGCYPFDEALGLVTGCTQLDMQQAAVKLTTEVPYDTAQALFGDLTGMHFGSERMHAATTQVGAGLTVLDVAPTREEIEQRIAAVAAGRFRRPVLVLGIDGAYLPTRPDSAREPGEGRRGKRARRARWRGQWRDAKGFRFYLLDGERIVHVLSWHQIHNEEQLGQALKQVKEAGLIPEEHVRLCVVCDGAAWIWKHVQALFPQARQVLDYYHCAQYLHRVAKAHYGGSGQACEWVEATMTRLYLGKVSLVLGGLKRMQAQSDEAKTAIANCWDYLDEHRGRTAYRTLRRGGYPLGSGGIESSNKFICHVRLKRSGAWWYESNSNQMLALRCAKYNGTFEKVFARYQSRLRTA
ncbi:MAG: ISKra4 family transposase [Candidatus Tectomicrobia bacterium]|uniref:ISKra4 family transposase n=1 Tax=Tectimicrobiota bacterium TaxID=2528274 RepID=A0A938B3V1_UNCTE|nr:ISKra4 family transposase [Candidatus Tectomicrobia bacterium]